MLCKPSLAGTTEPLLDSAGSTHSIVFIGTEKDSGMVDEMNRFRGDSETPIVCQRAERLNGHRASLFPSQFSTYDLIIFPVLTVMPALLFGYF
jgi:hypothetical protein